MHLIKNIAEHLVRLLSGLDDTIKVRTEEERRGRFREAWAKEGKSILPPAPFVLSAADIAITTERANCIQVPMTVEWKPRPIFVKNRGNMTSHQWKELVSTHILKYTLRGLLGKQQRETIFFFLNVLADLCAEVIDVATLDTLEYNVHKALSLIKRDFPVSLNVSVFHLLHHLPTYLRRFGPVYSFWMYPFERYNSWIIRRVLNRRYPEATAVETYRLYEWAHSLEIAGQLPNKALLDPTSPEELENTSDSMSAIVLTASQVDKLKQYYQKTLSSFRELCERYEEERRKARVRHQFRSFPDMSDWTPDYGAQLTPGKEEMRVVSNDALRLSRFVRYDSFGRRIMLSSMSSDTALSKSSYVYTQLHDRSYLFGRIQLIFSHSFCGSSNMFAYVAWFSTPQKDGDSGILFVNLDVSEYHNPVIPMSELCGPIITALDYNRLWILSVV